MDLDAGLDELYGLPPSEFTAARDERAKAARAAGDRALAARIRELRRPTLSAWAGNLLVRAQPAEVERLLRLGEALRRAHQELDGGDLRELSAQQHRLTFALSHQAARLAAEAGQRIGDGARQEVQDTLHAVLADPEAAALWSEGRLARPLGAPVGFPGTAALPASASSARSAPAGSVAARPEPAGRSAGRRGSGPAGEVADLDAARTRRREEEARRAERERRKREERWERARHKAEEAERELRKREGELVSKEQELSTAEGEEEQAGQRADDLARRLHEAEQDRQRTRAAARHLRDLARDARQAVREARRHAESAAEEAERKASELRDGSS
ncbi:hypothetical protein [Streptomyces mangrovisoli]|uniref:Uncharacterized protein n=1 Tax=Streptomyces mangrovisoli TaxID=1428628 RepID=A0A1J4NPS9_9ACTN|nr:hypothetical protein [Streptomyces mangrovisoli]OIJ64296.1 hypothetical protein WN71_029520 [Streptomyces mangrovisoli]